jgi:catechol 2,3-dioxygenase-like lactoylglutathione lyase family enzyme
VIKGAHVTVFAEEADAARAFFRDVLELDVVDAGGGWLIFALPPAEVAMHPTDEPGGRHELYLTCDDVEATVAELSARGVEFEDGVSDEAWGRLTHMRVPGMGRLGLYEPRHASPRSGAV